MSALDQLAGDVRERGQRGDPGSERRQDADEDDRRGERGGERARAVADGAEREAAEEDAPRRVRLEQPAGDRLRQTERHEPEGGDQRDGGARRAELTLPRLDEEPERPPRAVGQEADDGEGADADREAIPHGR